MQTFTNHAGATLHYDDVGEGAFVLALHGAYSTHLELAAALEPMLKPHASYRRIYPDLTGMGDSPAHDSIASTNDLVDLVEHLVDEVIGDSPLLVIGHSYGCHVGRALAARRPHQVAGIALICPMTPASHQPEAHAVARSEGDAVALVDPELGDSYAGYFVVHTPATAERFNIAVAPSSAAFDAEAVGQLMEAWPVEPDPDVTPYDHPTLIVTGRLDAWTGFRGALQLIDRYPRATFAVLADAGHALPHERPELLAALIADWLAATEQTI